MADLSKVKKVKPRPKASRFGDVPKPTDRSATLAEPEHAPAAETPTRKTRPKTGRTITFGTRVTPEFDEAFRDLAHNERLKHAELLERMLEQYQPSK